MRHYYAGAVSALDRSAICVIDDAGECVLACEAESRPEALIARLSDPRYPLERIGMEDGLISEYLCAEMAAAGLPVVCVSAPDGLPRSEAHLGEDDLKAAEALAGQIRHNEFDAVEIDPRRFKKFVPASSAAAYAVLDWFEIDRLRDFSDAEWEAMAIRMRWSLAQAGLFEEG